MFNVKKQLSNSSSKILDNFTSDEVVVINKDSYKFKRNVK